MRLLSCVCSLPPMPLLPHIRSVAAGATGFTARTPPDSHAKLASFRHFAPYTGVLPAAEDRRKLGSFRHLASNVSPSLGLGVRHPVSGQKQPRIGFVPSPRSPPRPPEIGFVPSSSPVGRPPGPRGRRPRRPCWHRPDVDPLAKKTACSCATACN